MLYVFLIAVSLALDAFAVSVSAGLTVRGFKLRDAVKMGIWFGFFQFIMPVIGWFLGSTVAELVSAFAPWISFGLLAFIGGKMVWESIRGGDEPMIAALDPKTLFMLAVATSIDALAVGVTFAFMDINIWLSSVVIGVVAFGLSIAGGLIGGRLGDKFSDRAELFGGLVLIAIGLKLLIESFI